MLLDTNALLWVYHDSERLGPLARERIGAASLVHFSSASVLEIVIKNMLGRLPLPGGDELSSVFSRSGLTELPFTAEHAAALARFPGLARHDPFDRMILAQASQERMPLVTSDATLLSLGEDRVIDARR
ncbi:type II toxin-antitoxin system VapC family toxin [Microbacterium sp. NIBRBAC000506063]|uniref:type II toxin-antitoxin system VapC family toxin n=1 Tax=Microbacterium sp. NIBRBAC000506063 TaxID=2734618 RepID=UPI001BB7C379|nr:type II toxin-antitoxin system VapC family toxin [Microbacterium sp. NIBRBAC000506063]QTV79942.1 type II toxin-antitoxin system VapC family toxin [Microbacterium sp. NIBRBAC000506063]